MNSFGEDLALDDALEQALVSDDGYGSKDLKAVQRRLKEAVQIANELRKAKLPVDDLGYHRLIDLLDPPF